MRLLIGVGCLFLLSSAAIADQIFSVQETRQIAYRYGKCLVSHHVGSASKAVLRNESNEKLIRYYSILLNGECLGPGIRLAFPGDTYRYILADALVARELAKVPAPDLSKVPALEQAPAPLPPPPPFIANKRSDFLYARALEEAERAKRFRELSVYGECVVRADAVNAKALLLAEPESWEEHRGMEALIPALSRCTSAGTTLSFSKTALRGSIAVNYYRLAQAALHLPVH